MTCDLTSEVSWLDANIFHYRHTPGQCYMTPITLLLNQSTYFSLLTAVHILECSLLNVAYIRCSLLLAHCEKSIFSAANHTSPVPEYIPGGAKKNVPNIRRCYTAVLLTDF